VALTFVNPTAGAIDAASQTYKFVFARLDSDLVRRPAMKLASLPSYPAGPTARAGQRYFARKRSSRLRRVTGTIRPPKCRSRSRPIGRPCSPKPKALGIKVDGRWGDKRLAEASTLQRG